MLTKISVSEKLIALPPYSRNVGVLGLNRVLPNILHVVFIGKDICSV